MRNLASASEKKVNIILNLILRSWQIAQFEQTPVVFIRIVGTYNSANEVFHCVHFECPAMDINEEVEEERKKKVQNVKASVTDYSSQASTYNMSNNANSQKNAQILLDLTISDDDESDTIYEVIDEDRGLVIGEYREEPAQDEHLESTEESCSDN